MKFKYRMVLSLFLITNGFSSISNGGECISEADCARYTSDLPSLCEHETELGSAFLLRAKNSNETSLHHYCNVSDREDCLIVYKKQFSN